MAASPALLSSQPELQKLETEIKDRLIIETETENLQVDINPREILQMSEDQWRVLGPNFELPYGEGSSSSKIEDNSEVFRVYFKGLLSEEKVHDATMAGIGVAICDSRDQMIFELKKPLDLSKGDRISRQSVEWQALIEGLKAATALELKRIVFYCDYYPLYQYVSRRWRPKQQKITNFLDEVNLLRKSFTYCEHSLIARKDVKFAFKLAREAINSQTSKVVSTQEKLENCVICLDDKSVDQFLSIEGCTHRYCYSCVKQHVEVQLLNGVLPKCPHEGCRNKLRTESCEKFLIPKFTEMMRQRLKEDSIPVTEKVYCPYPKCSTLMSKTEVLGLINEIGAITCYKCHGNFCIDCRVPWHEDLTCEEYKRRNPTSLVEESKLKNLAARNLWRQCIKCKHMIELAAGCYHMTCRCGYEFCYTCGGEWKNKKATCTCPLWDEENILYAVEEDNEDVGFNNFGAGVVLEANVLDFNDFIDFEDGLEDDILEDDYFEDDVHEDDYVSDFGDDVGLEDDDFEDDVLHGDDVHEDDVIHGDAVVPEDDYFEDDVIHEDDVGLGLGLEDDDFEEDVVQGDAVVPEDDDINDFEDDVIHGYNVGLDDVIHGDDDVPEDYYFEHDGPEDDYGGFEYDVVEDQYDDEFW